VITEISDGKTRLLLLHPESAHERDELLQTLKYPVPLNPEDMRDHGQLSLADYEVQPQGGQAGFGYVALEFQESPRSQNSFDPDRHLRPVRVPTGELLGESDLQGLWRFNPSPGSGVLPFDLEIEQLTGGTIVPEAFGLITGKWGFANRQGRLPFRGSADGRTAAFSFQLNRERDIWLVGMFTGRGTAIATYRARSEDGFLIGQVEGLRLP
jgi:hypothetical protein